MREKVHLCGESKKKARGDAAAQRGDTEVAVCIFKNVDRKVLSTCNKKQCDQMKIFSIWANVSIPDEGRERIRR